MNEKILLVDDEVNILEAHQRSLRKEFQLEVAMSGEHGLAAIQSRGPYAVVVSDMRMPEMNGVEFLAKVKEKAPKSVRIMLTGNNDLETAMQAVNEGHIFRFLTKPCPPEKLALALTAGIEHYRLLMAEKELLEKTLCGSVKMLTDLLSIVNPTAFGNTMRVRHLARKIAAAFEIKNTWRVEMAAMLSQVGCITIPEATLVRLYSGLSLTADELQMWLAHPQIGRDLVMLIPRLEEVAEIIAWQEKGFDGSGPPISDRSGQEIPQEARVLKLALDFDKLIGLNPNAFNAYKEIKKRVGRYDPCIIEALKCVLDSETEVMYELRDASVDELALYMILAEDILSVRGQQLLEKSQEVTPALSLRLKSLAKCGVIKEPIKVFVPMDSVG